MKRLVKWLVGLVVLSGVAALLTWAFIEGREEFERERQREMPVKIPPRTARGPDGEAYLTLDAATQTRLALKFQPLQAVTQKPDVVAYGVFQEDPSQTFALRAPLAGTIKPAEGVPWPQVGQRVEAGANFGALVPRLAPVDRTDLAARLATARANVKEASAALAAARESYEGKKALNVREEIVPKRALEEAEARMKAEEARLRGAEETVRLIEAALKSGSRSDVALPLRLAVSGEIVAVLARPEKSVEAGTEVIRVNRFESLLARVDVPIGETFDPAFTMARVAPLGREQVSIRAERIGLAPESDPRTRATTLLLRVLLADAALRPGMAITALIPAPGDAQPGVVVPEIAVVRYAGKAWVYVVDGDRFERREVSLAHWIEGGWFVAAELQPGEQIITAGAQSLLSEELKFQIEIGEEGEGKGND